MVACNGVDFIREPLRPTEPLPLAVSIFAPARCVLVRNREKAMTKAQSGFAIQ
jgi:hypothetical protein